MLRHTVFKTQIITTRLDNVRFDTTRMSTRRLTQRALSVTCRLLPIFNTTRHDTKTQRALDGTTRHGTILEHYLNVRIGEGHGTQQILSGVVKHKNFYKKAMNFENINCAY
jgi:hypothetical protein